MELLIYPDAKLTNPNELIKEWKPEYDTYIKEMFDIMYKTKGIGLAAPQVGWNVKLFIFNLSGDFEMKGLEQVVYNPTMTLSGDDLFNVEGCLSFPGISAKIKRKSQAHVVGQSPTGPVEFGLDGLGSVAMQHEMDHIDGMLFIERMTPAEFAKNRTMINKLKNARKDGKGKS